MKEALYSLSDWLYEEEQTGDPAPPWVRETLLGALLWFEETIGHDGAPDGGDPGWVWAATEAVSKADGVRYPGDFQSHVSALLRKRKPAVGAYNLEEAATMTTSRIWETDMGDEAIRLATREALQAAYQAGREEEKKKGLEVFKMTLDTLKEAREGDL